MTFTGRTGTALLAALIVSLCVNLLLAGLVAGAHWHDRGPWWRDIPEEARPVMKQVFEAHKAEFDAYREKVQQARQRVADVLKADPVDQAQLDQALSALSQQSQAMQQFGHRVMVEMAQKLPPDVRSEMADRWAKDRFRKSAEP